MKIFYILSYLLTGLISAEELFPKDLVGLWKVTHVLKKNEGLTTQINETALFLDDGSAYMEGLFHIEQDEEKIKLLSIGGPDLNEWSLKDGKLITKTTDFRFDLVISHLDPELLAKVLDGINKEVAEINTYTLVSKSTDKVILKDETANSIHTYTRIKNGKLKSLLTLKNRAAIEQLFKNPTRLEEGKVDLIGQQFRRLSHSLLTSQKFKFASSLPTFSDRPAGIESLRDRKEILDRLLCFYAVNYWVLIPEEKIPSKSLKAFIKEFNLAGKLSKEETAILALSREEANDQHAANIGWQLENMFALSWILGMEMCPEVTDAMAGDEVVNALIAHINKEITALRAGKPLTKIKTLREVAQLEDIFYCAHNAVRSGQTGKKDTLPKGFHPILNGGVISEKRHALTWAISPNVKWDDTNLDT